MIPGEMFIADGEIVARGSIGENNSLSGIAQYPGK